MAKPIKQTNPNLATAYDLVLTDLFSSLKKLKDKGVIKLGNLGTLQKKKTQITTALNGKTYVYYRLNNPLMNNQFPNQQTQEQINPQKMTTGQKIPQMSGTMGEIQQGIQTMQMTLGQIIQQQKNLDQRLSNLENSASQQFTNLIQQ
ncbi:12847_t:CDS:2, partial [Ambispora gerdemannii]